MYLFDTDVLSNLLSRNPSARLLGKLQGLKKAEAFTTTITVAEIYYGVFKSRRADYFCARLEDWLGEG